MNEPTTETERGAPHTSGWTSWVAGILVVLILLAAGWSLRGCAVPEGPPQVGGAQIWVFNTEKALGLMGQETAEDPLLSQAERIERIEQLLEQIAQETGAVIIQSGASLAFPDAVDITEQVLERAEELTEGEASNSQEGEGDE